MFALMMLITARAMWKGKKEVSPGSRSSTLSFWNVLLIGLSVGFFTGLVGAGGGFLVVPTLVLLGGLSMRKAVGTSLVVITANSIAGFSGYISHVEVNYKLAVVLITASVLGSLVGVLASRKISQPKLRRGFSVLVALMGAYILIRELP